MPAAAVAAVIAGGRFYLNKTQSKMREKKQFYMYERTHGASAATQHSHTLNAENCSANMHLIMRRFWNDCAHAHIWTRSNRDLNACAYARENTRCYFCCCCCCCCNVSEQSSRTSNWIPIIKCYVCIWWKVHKMFKITVP